MPEGRVTLHGVAETTEAGLRRGLGSPALFAIVYSLGAASIYFALGAVADHALAVTPFVYIAAGLFFQLSAMTYVEGASLHQERAGSTVFARYAFNELVSFVAGWALLLDYTILIALTAFTATNYLAAFWPDLGSGLPEVLMALAIIAYVAIANVRGLPARRLRRFALLAIVDVALQLVIIGLGFVLVFKPHLLTGAIHLGTTPQWDDVLFALTIAVAGFTGLESASGLAGEVEVRRRGLKRLVGTTTATVTALYAGIALIALTALPVAGNETSLSRNYLEDPLRGVVQSFYPLQWPSDVLDYVVGAVGAVVLIAAANSAMLGLSRLAYSLATNRQIPSAVGRLHPRRATPYVAIGIAAVLAALLVLPQDLNFLIGIYAFGAMLAFTIAHLSIIVLRYREPDRPRPYRIPLSVQIGGGSLPLPAVAGALLAGAGWVSVLVLHSGARTVGLIWMAFGLALYVIYRTSERKPVFKRVVVPEAALREEPTDVEYGSILVPIFGTELDDDIVQTAGRLAAEEGADEGAGVIEALWVFEMPMSLPLDARLPDSRIEEARRSLRRAKAVGEEYAGVEVATATVRARRVGEAIVDEARRRGVEAIVLAAEESSRIRGGAILGGRGGPQDQFVGDATRYVVRKAPCRVILTAPARPSDEPSDGDGALSARAERQTT